MRNSLISLLLIIFFCCVPAVQAHARTHLEQGKRYYIYRKYDKAREMFQKSIERNENGDAHYFLAEIEKIEGNFSEAEAHYKKAVELRTTKKYKKNAYWNLIVFAEQRGNHAEIVELCKDMWLALRDDSARSKIESIINKRLWTDNQEAVEAYKEALKLKERKKNDLAVEYFQKALNIDYAFLAPRFELAMIYYGQENFNIARNYLVEVTTRIPYYAEAQLILGDICFKNREYNNVIAHIGLARRYGILDRKTEYQVLLKIATSHYSLNNLDEAITAAEEAGKSNPRSIEPLLLRSAIHIKKQDYNTALETLRKAEKMDNDNPAILFQIGNIYFKQNDWRFLHYYDRLYNQTGKERRQKDPYIEIGRILSKAYFEKGNYARVITLVSEMDSTASYDQKILLARSFYHSGKYDSSIDVFKTLSLGSEDKFMLCLAYARSGRKTQAKEELKYLIYQDEYHKKAEGNPYLRSILKEIEKEREQGPPEPASPPKPPLSPEKFETGKDEPGQDNPKPGNSGL